MPPAPDQTIAQAIEQLDALVDQYHEAASPAGYFPALYGRVTKEVARQIEEGAFDDNQRMERFDVLFANRYLEALQAWRDGRKIPASWQLAFQAVESPRRPLIVLQHLLLGMNAHINFDLALSAADSCEGVEIEPLKGDFYHINRILGSMIDGTQQRLTRIFGGLGLIDRLLGRADERLSLFSLRYARDKAWQNAKAYHALDSSAEREAFIARRDEAVARFGRCIARPPSLLLRINLAMIRLLERGNVADRIRVLATMDHET